MVLVFFVTAFAWAQDEGGGGGGGDSYGSEMGFHLGQLLPNQVEGVTEILPVYGFRYGYPTKAGIAELGLNNTHARGIDFTTIELGLRADLEPMPNFLANVMVGGDMHYYSPENSNDRQTHYGGHVGTGLMMLVSDTLWARGEMKFLFNPGVAMYFGFGFVLRSKGGGGN